MKKINKQKYLSKTRSKVSKDWQAYREKKEKILNRRIGSSKKQELIKGLLSSTREKISKDFSDYRIKVYNADTSHPFIKQKETILKTGIEEKYKIKKGTSTNVYKTLNKFSNKKGVRYILVIIELYMIDSDRSVFVSQNFTPLAIERIDENILNEIVGAFIKKNSNTSHIEDNYTIKNVFIRLIYENAKTDKQQTTGAKTRKNKT